MAEETLPTSIREKETLAQKSCVSPPPLSYKTENSNGDLEVNGSARLQNLAERSTCVFNSTPCGNKLVGIRNKMGTKFASKFNSTLVVKSQLFKVVKGMLSVAGPTNTQKDGVE
eukprot:750498-Pelagomonas_calceolata.AAC.1